MKYQLLPRLLFSVWLCAATWTAAAREKLSIAKVSPGMTSAEAVRILGRPDRKSSTDGFIRWTYHYPGLVVGFDEDLRVAGIESTSSKFCFDGWLCPGHSSEKIKNRIPASNFRISKNGDVISIFGDGCWAEIKSTNKVVRSIAVICQP